MATQLMLLPYLQGWNGTNLTLRLLAAPQFNPLDPLVQNLRRGVRAPTAFVAPAPGAAR